MDRFKTLLLLAAMLVSFGLIACGQEPTLAPTAVPSTAKVTSAGAEIATRAPAQPKPSPTSTAALSLTLTPAATVQAAPTLTPEPTRQDTPTAKSSPGPTALPAPISTPTPVPSPVSTVVPLTLELLSPQDGAISEIGAVRVLGITRVDAVVGVNGIPVDVATDGGFQRDITLEEGANFIEVVATGLSGEAVYQPVAIFYIPPTAGLAFSLFYPPDGLSVSEPNIPVIGGTRLDAAVAVNGSPVEVNVSGLFSTTISLDPGANLIEVVAADIQGDVRVSTVAVFYLP